MEYPLKQCIFSVTIKKLPDFSKLWFLRINSSTSTGSISRLSITSTSKKWLTLLIWSCKKALLMTKNNWKAESWNKIEKKFFSKCFYPTEWTETRTIICFKNWKWKTSLFLFELSKNGPLRGWDRY